MTNIKKTLPFIFILFLLSSCNFLQNSMEYKKGTEEFMVRLMAEDYEYCASKMENGESSEIPADSMKIALSELRNSIVSNWGDNLEYTFMGSEKSFSTLENSLPTTTTIHMQFAEKEKFGVIKAIYNDDSKKIMGIRPLKRIWGIPNMTYFWIFGLLPLAVLFFNIYTLRQIKKSQLDKKWLHYLLVFIFNTPVLSYHALSGFSFKMLSFQFLLGTSFSFMGFLNTTLAFGIPLGSIYCLWKIRKQTKEDKGTTE